MFTEHLVIYIITLKINNLIKMEQVPDLKNSPPVYREMKIHAVVSEFIANRQTDFVL